MKFKFRWMALVLCVAALVGPTMADESNVHEADPCGDPRLESQAYASAEGTVVEVLDGNTLVVDFQARFAGDREGKKTVRMVNLEVPPVTEPVGLESQARLDATLSGKSVSVLVSPVQEDGAPLNAMVQIRGGHSVDENAGQLEKGLARYRNAGTYAVGGWTDCHYRRAEAQARKAKVGLWGEASESASEARKEN